MMQKADVYWIQLSIFIKKQKQEPTKYMNELINESTDQWFDLFHVISFLQIRLVRLSCLH